MYPSQAAKILETQFDSYWVNTPIVWENTPARDLAAVDQTDLYAGDVPFIELTITPGFPTPITVPLGCIRYNAFLEVAVIAPRYSGSRHIDELIGNLMDLLEYKTLCADTECLRVKGMMAGAGTVIRDEWLRTIVQFPFEYERLR